MKKISVIVPIYNTSQFLKRCIDSLISQTYENIEIILVDDGSTDDSLDICNSYKEKYHFIKVFHKENGGLSSARNYGIEQSTGELIAFIDSDDYVEKDMFCSLEAMLHNSETNISCCNYVRFNENGVINKKHIIYNEKKCVCREDYLESLLLHLGDVSVCTKLFPKKVIANNRFNENKLNEDLLFMFDISFENIIFSGNIGYHYFCRQNSLSNSFSKAVLDMGYNSIDILSKVQLSLPQLIAQATHFSLVQNMYLLLKLPKKMRKRKNIYFRDSLSFIKRTFRGKNTHNVYLSSKEKKYLYFLCLFPRIFLLLYHFLKKLNMLFNRDRILFIKE